MKEVPQFFYIPYIVITIVVCLILYFGGRWFYKHFIKSPISVPYVGKIGFLWPCFIVYLGIIVYSYIYEKYCPKNIVNICIVSSPKKVEYKKYFDYFETPLGERLYYYQQNESKDFWVLNNTNELMLSSSAFYYSRDFNGKKIAGVAIDTIAKPGEMVNIKSKPDYWLQPLPHSIGVQTSSISKIDRIYKSAIFLESQIR